MLLRSGGAGGFSPETKLIASIRFQTSSSKSSVKYVFCIPSSRAIKW